MVKAVADTICTGIQLSEHHIATTWHSCYKFGKLMADYGSGVEQGFFFFSIRRSLVRFPWSACRSVLGQPQTAPDVLVSTLHGSHYH